MKYLKYYFFTIIILILFSSSILSTKSVKTNSNNLEHKSYTLISSTNFIWPTPGYNRISSKFGKRNAPTKGASTSHSGIDIAAPSGTNILSVSDGVVTYTGFKGAGGFTITIKSDEYQFSYCHVSPNFLVNVGDYISKGSIISKVGPYNVYNVPNNPYKDSKGKPTNGASTGPHLHLTIRKNDGLINPLDLLTQ